MRCAIIADIHANLEAFTAVLEDIRKRGGVEEVWCLGDIVGYGPDPHECVDLMRRQKHIAVAGNHDLAAIGKITTDQFNPQAAAAVEWTIRQLSQSDVNYLLSLPLVVEKDDFTLVHGSPRAPIWEYITSTQIASENLLHFETPYCLFGHSHTPVTFRCQENGDCVLQLLEEETMLALGRERLLANPGGVGQPRDGDPRASYAIFDREEKAIRFHRVAYHIANTQAKMLKHKLPSSLITRLSFGL
ncbi:MAG: metallophosphoesterase family protein [Chloroflexi bacterium]|nr:metallophosphoesterase family protein [Chloroflexota bacterium]